MDATGGLARQVRACTESEQFDLGGYSKEQCVSFVSAAFDDPVPLSAMVRLSFVVGGGKGCRQKYSDDLPKDFTNALATIGFNDDKAASCEMTSAGSYKFQHDTSKNLKFVHVFPRVCPPAAEGEGEDEAQEEGPRDPTDVLAECAVDEFRRLVASHVSSYGLKKRLLEALKAREVKLESAEQKLIARAELDAEEQALYDTLNIDLLKEKAQILSGELQAAIENGKLTSEERNHAQEQFASKQDLLETELEKAKSAGKAKMQAKLEEQVEKLKLTRTKLAGVHPIEPMPLRHTREIQSLQTKLLSLERLEKELANSKHTLDELKRLGEMPELREAIGVLEQRSRLWFETDAEFQRRRQICLRGAPQPKKSTRPASDSFQTVKKGGRK
uniref:Uncharacterized protein n=1 Tax=Noctiluca scintillans TaxID=2966 RepID=A0A7S0ZSX9_NOCSC